MQHSSSIAKPFRSALKGTMHNGHVMNDQYFLSSCQMKWIPTTATGCYGTYGYGDQGNVTYSLNSLRYQKHIS